MQVPNQMAPQHGAYYQHATPGGQQGFPATHGPMPTPQGAQQYGFGGMGGNGVQAGSTPGWGNV